MKLLEVAQSWGTEEFNAVLKSAVEQMDGRMLPLQQGLERSSVASDENIKAMVLKAVDVDNAIEAKVGVFYSGLIAGCACDDDPTPQDEIPEYCDVLVKIAKSDGSASVSLWQEH